MSCFGLLRASHQLSRLQWLVVLLCASVPVFADHPLPAPTAEVILEVHGKARRSAGYDHARLDRDTLSSLKRTELVTHTSVTDGPQHFSGYLMRDLLEYVGAKGKKVVASALNSYAIVFSSEEFDRYDVLIADTQNGKQLLPSDKGPFWIVYPRDQHSELQDIRYDYRWVWQLVRLDIE